MSAESSGILTILLLSGYLLLSLGSIFLSTLNLRHLRLHGDEIPAGFEEYLDTATLRNAVSYAVEQSRADLAEAFFSILILLTFLFGGILGSYDRWVISVTHSFFWGGVLFFPPLFLAQSLLQIPFSLYRCFRIESRYGFNTMTPRLWMTDFLKSTSVGILLITLATAGAFALVRLSPSAWWLWVWGFLAALSLFLLYLSPYIIEPLFFRFEPVRKEGLDHEIRALMMKAGLEVSRVLQVDASRRSRHSNAYFTGIGRVKRIILFDTLLECLEPREVLAVLAHEAGHWKNHDLLKRLVLAEVTTLLACCTAFHLINWGGLPQIVGMESASFPARLLILGFLFSLVSSLFTPLANWLSRRQERRADRFASALSGTPDALAEALIKMSRDNLSNLYPHPLYAAVYYSHPPVVERVATLRSMTGERRS